MNAPTLVILLILFVIVLFSIKSYMKKLASGCCGGSDRVHRVHAADGNPAHYAHHKVVTVDGLVCANCQKRVENAFNAQPGLLCRVNMEKKTADVYSKAPLEDAEIRRIVREAGYAALDIAAV